MRANRRYQKKLISDLTIWVLLLASVIFMAVCPPMGIVCIGCVLFA